MDLFLELLRYLLPSIICLTAAYLFIVRFLNTEDRRRKGEILLENRKIISPMRLQAYERVVLFLERIAPDNLLMRVSSPGISSSKLQSELVKTIRSEFDHNISQQVYISAHSWHLVKSAKEETIKIINLAYSKVGQQSEAIELSKEIFRQLSELEGTPSETALTYIRKEIHKTFF